MNTFAILSIVCALVSSIVIAFDLLKRRQSMPIMNAVWILTGLWAGLLALVLYFWFGREKKQNPKGAFRKKMTMSMPMDRSMSMPKEGGMGMDQSMKSDRAKWQSVVLSTLHCGAGCTLADLTGEWLVYFAAITIAGSTLLGSVFVDYLLALCIGVFFQYAAIKSMGKIKRTDAFVKALKADVLSLTAWQIGMYGFMAVALFVLFPNDSLHRDSSMFWLMMQVAMFFGFLLSLPVNLLLIKAGVKRAM